MPPRQRYRLENYNPRGNYRHAAAGAAGATYAGNAAWNWLKAQAQKEATIKFREYTSRNTTQTRKTRSDKGKPRVNRQRATGPRHREGMARGSRGFVGSSYSGTGTFGSNMTRIKRPIRGNVKSKYGKLIVNRKPSKIARANYRKYPEYIKQTFYLCTPNMDASGKVILWQDKRYTNSSAAAKYLTGLLFNVGCVELNWDPSTNRIGNALLPANSIENPLFQLNNTNTGLESVESMITQYQLPETSTPFNTGTLNPLLQYTIPNTLLTGINLNLTLGTASAQTQYLTVKVLRYSAAKPVIPGWFTEAATTPDNLNAIKELMNRHNATNGKKYQTIFQTTIKMNGLAPSTTKYVTHRVKKYIKLDYSRSTSRRVGSATDEGFIGTSALPQFEVDPTGAMFNNVFVIITSSLTDDQYVSKTTTQSSNTGVPPVVTQWIESTTIRDMERAETGFAQFRYGGTIQIIHKAQEASRGLSSASVATTTNNIVALEQRLLKLECSVDPEKEKERVTLVKNNSSLEDKKE